MTPELIRAYNIPLSVTLTQLFKKIPWTMSTPPIAGIIAISTQYWGANLSVWAYVAFTIIFLAVFTFILLSALQIELIDRQNYWDWLTTQKKNRGGKK